MFFKRETKLSNSGFAFFFFSTSSIDDAEHERVCESHYGELSAGQRSKVKDVMRKHTHHTQILPSVQPELGGGVTIRLQLRPPINSSTDKLLIKADSSTLL